MFWLTILTAIILRIYLILRDSVPFAYDMGRDLLWAKDIVFYHTPTLIGPAASIWGVYFGPLWFYLLAIPLWLSNGNPISAVYLTLLINVLTGVLAYWLFAKRINNLFALIFTITILFSGSLINISTFAFHANLLPFLTLWLIFFAYLAITQNPLYLSLSFFAASIMYHADPAPAVVFTFVPIFVLVFQKLYQSKNFHKLIFVSAALFLLPFSPQTLFEIRNQFIQTKSLIAYFMGNNPSLSGQLPLLPRIENRLVVYFNFFKASFAADNIFLAIILLLIVGIGLYFFTKTEKNHKLLILFKINILSLIASFLIFTFAITVEVKNWYLFPLIVILSFLISFSLYGFKKNQLAIVMILIAYILVNVWPYFNNTQIIKKRADPALFINQLSAINLIYGDTKSTPFSVYIFTPPIYDLHYQYLFWWQGVKLKKGLPADFAYLPNQPDYVRNKDFYAPEAGKSDLIYLIIENAKENEFYTKESWLKNFQDYKLLWGKYINKAITVQKRQK